MEVQRHLKEAGFERFDLWQEMASAIAPGDTFQVTAGCDKRFTTCRNRFTNHENFRGFPHMPGNDFALSYVRRDGRNDGGAESGE